MREIDILSKYYNSHRDVYNIERIGIFGSVAKGNTNDNSDIDIVVELKYPKMMALIAIKQELEEIYQKNIDIVRLRKNMNSFLRKQIEQEAIYVQ